MSPTRRRSSKLVSCAFPPWVENIHPRFVFYYETCIMGGRYTRNYCHTCRGEQNALSMDIVHTHKQRHWMRREITIYLLELQYDRYKTLVRNLQQNIFIFSAFWQLVISYIVNCVIRVLLKIIQFNNKSFMSNI